METKKRKEFVVEGYIIHNNKVLLLHHKKLGLWLPPGGHIEESEIPEETLIREVKEETNLDIEIIKQVKPRHNFKVKILNQPRHIQLENIKGTHYHIDLVYLCRVSDDTFSISHESEDANFFSLNEIDNLSDIPEDVKYYSKIFLKEKIDNIIYKLPVLKEIIADNKIDFSNLILLVVQHIKKNTVRFIELLSTLNFREITIIGKPYSVDQGALKEIRKYCKVVIPTFEDMEELKVVKDVVGDTAERGNKFICLDLGGYFSRYFQQLERIPKTLLGIIEDTKNGIWFDKDINLKFSLLSIASSELKDYAENYFVAKAIIRNTENILVDHLQQTLSIKKVLILGYGKIGEFIAESLKNESVIFIYDKSPIQLLKAKVNGFEVIDNLLDLSDFDIIIGVTGNIILKEELLNLKNGVILINGSTRKKEFDISTITQSIKREEKEETFIKYELNNTKNIYLLADGFPVNFLGTESVPEFILDIVFSEIFILITILAQKKISSGYYPIECFCREKEEEIARRWLNYWQ